MKLTFRHIISFITKLDYYFCYLCLSHADRCAEASITYSYCIALVSIFFIHKFWRCLQYLRKPINFGEQFAYCKIYFNIFEIFNMQVFTDLVAPYIPERRITSIKIPSVVFKNYSKLILQYFPIILSSAFLTAFNFNIIYLLTLIVCGISFL